MRKCRVNDETCCVRSMLLSDRLILFLLTLLLCTFSTRLYMINPTVKPAFTDVVEAADKY